MPRPTLVASEEDTSVNGGKGTRAGVARKANSLKVVCNDNNLYRGDQQLPYFFENQGIHKSNSKSKSNETMNTEWKERHT